MSDKEKLIQDFRLVTGADEERSKFYLEAAAWSIETALESFYDREDPVPESEAPKKMEKRKPDMPKLSMLDSESSEEEGQAFYAGGSVHSGQQVLGPSRKKKDVVSMLFKSAKEHGAEVMESKDKGTGKKLTFAGAGYRLGETDSDHEVVSQPSKNDEPPRDVTLRMWKTGFTVDDGRLRGYEDPVNHEFLSSVRRGQVPLELVRNSRGGEVFINMEDHRHEDFVSAKSRAPTFSGVGHTLGSPAPSVVGQVIHTGTPGGSSGRTTISAPAAGPENTALLEGKAKEELVVDASKPVTNVQVRLSDASRLVLRLNHSHTVGDIRRYIMTARPRISSPFAIMTTFPHAELADDSKTLSEANLLNAALVLK